MKKKFLAALVCVAIVLSMCSIMAFAATTTTINEITCEDEITLDIGAKKVTSPINYISIASAEQTTDSETTELVVGDGEASKYLKATVSAISGSAPNETVTIQVAPANSNVTIASGAQKTFTVAINRAQKLYTLTTGVRKYNSNGKALSASEIAKVTTTVTYKKDGVTVKSVSDNIYDLNFGDHVELKAELKDKYKDFYVFSCWVDGDGTVIDTNNPLNNPKTPSGIDIAGNVTLYAVFKEAKDRYIIDVSTSDGGAVIFNDELRVIGEVSDNVSSDKVAGKSKEKDIDTGLLGVDPTSKETVTGGTSAQVSVMEGTTPTFTFVPDSGYEVSKVTVGGNQQISSYRWVARKLADMFTASDFTNVLKVMGTFRDATNKDVYTYTFDPITGDTSIDVQFSKKVKLEPGTGVEYVPGPELSTGADTTDKADATDANGQPAAAANPAATTLPAENAVDYFSSDVANPQTGSSSTTAAIAAFATISFAAAAAFVSYKKKH